MIKPLGVYGSKDEIVRLLRSIDVVDDITYVFCVLNISSYEISRVQSDVTPCSK
jgi:hypothetical protein